MVGNYVLRLFFVLCIGASLAASPLRAEMNRTLDPVVVTGSRFPAVESESHRMVTVITAEDMRARGARNLFEGLSKTGGLAFKTQGPLGLSNGGMTSDLSIRGLPGGELVLVNGMPIQSAGGASYDLDTIPIEQIDRVEILKGAASTLYGADAMTGVINIITRQPEEVELTNMHAEIGEYGYQNYSVGFSNADVTAGLTYQHLDDLHKIYQKTYLSPTSRSTPSHYDVGNTDRYGFNLSFSPLQDLTFDLLASYYRSGWQKVYDAGGKSGIAGQLEKQFTQQKYKLFTDLRYEKDRYRLKGFFSLGTTNVDYDMYGGKRVTDGSRDSWNKEYNAGASGDYRFDLPGDIALTTGAEYIYRAANYRYKYKEHHRHDVAAFVEAEKTFFRRLTLTLGMREQCIFPEKEGDDYNRWLPAAGLSFRLTDATRLFASFSTAFRAPTFNQMFNDSSRLVGNPNLHPEKGRTYEAGVKFTGRAVKIRLAGFYMDYEDKIDTGYIAGIADKTYFNAGDYESIGVEWQADWHPFVGMRGPLHALDFRWSGYWADPSAKDPDGQEYRPGPKFQSSMGASWQWKRVDLELTGTILAGREDFLDAACPLDISAGYRLPVGRLYIAVTNLLDEEVVSAGNQDPESSYQYEYYELPRLARIGYEVSF
jgi:iron complex outermembrane receptor protein